MDLMKDEGLKKSVIEQMMGELGDVTAKGLKRADAPVKGVEIAITVSPKGDMDKDMDETECGVEGCEDPAHNHPADAEAEAPESSDYISDMIKKLG